MSDSAFTCPECGAHFDSNDASEEVEAFGGVVCPECGYTGMDDDF